VVVSADPAADPVARATALSFRDVYRDHFAFVWRMTRRLGVAHSSVDDVVQDVFVVLHRRLPEYDGRVPVRTWLFGILSFVVRDHRRRFRRKDARCVPPPRDSQSDIALPSADMSPAARAEHAERVALLRHLLDALDDAKRELLVLAYLEQMTVPEIAELLGLNLNTAYSRLRAAKQAFDQLYAAEQARAKRGEP
jgi:RNA polymerase sigma-70 factor (ECF subfamily)